MKNCPNCGAPFGSAPICNFCGTLKDDILTVDDGSTVDIVYRKDGYEYWIKGIVSEWSYTDLYCDDTLYATLPSTESARLSVEMRLAMRDDGSFMLVKKEA